MTGRGAALILSVLGVVGLASCEREKRDVRGQPFAETAPNAQLSELVPGGAAQTPPDPRDKLYEGNAFHISQGQRLYHWFNCDGCHFHGGGGIGPPLMGGDWRYGGSLDQIYASISEGRPNGMPSWKAKIPPQQIWQLAAYVRSLSGNAPAAAEGSRGEEMSSTPPPDLTPPSSPKPSLEGLEHLPRP